MQRKALNRIAAGRFSAAGRLFFRSAGALREEASPLCRRRSDAKGRSAFPPPAACSSIRQGRFGKKRLPYAADALTQKGGALPWKRPALLLSAAPRSGVKAAFRALPCRSCSAPPARRLPDFSALRGRQPKAACCARCFSLFMLYPPPSRLLFPSLLLFLRCPRLFLCLHAGSPVLLFPVVLFRMPSACSRHPHIILPPDPPTFQARRWLLGGLRGIITAVLSQGAVHALYP